MAQGQKYGGIKWESISLGMVSWPNPKLDTKCIKNKKFLIKKKKKKKKREWRKTQKYIDKEIKFTDQ